MGEPPGQNKPNDVAVHDPDDWRGWWLDLHPCDLFDGHLARLALERLAIHGEDGPGLATLRFTEGDDQFEVEVSFLLERFPKGRVFHILSIRSEGDPLPPFSDV